MWLRLRYWLLLVTSSKRGILSVKNYYHHAFLQHLKVWWSDDTNICTYHSWNGQVTGEQGQKKFKVFLFVYRCVGMGVMLMVDANTYHNALLLMGVFYLYRWSCKLLAMKRSLIIIRSSPNLAFYIYICFITNDSHDHLYKLEQCIVDVQSIFS